MAVLNEDKNRMKGNFYMYYIDPYFYNNIY